MLPTAHFRGQHRTEDEVRLNPDVPIDPSRVPQFSVLFDGLAPAEGRPMVRTRLDSVVQVKERVEEKAGRALAQAESAVSAAKSKVAEAKRLASQDHRTRADVSAWEVTEFAHHRAIADAKKAQKELETLQKSAQHVRTQYISAHQAAEVVRRVASSRREEAIRELNRVEDKALDETASLLFFRRAG